jgi:hypothetical protein
MLDMREAVHAWDARGAELAQRRLLLLETFRGLFRVTPHVPHVGATLTVLFGALEHGAGGNGSAVAAGGGAAPTRSGSDAHVRRRAAHGLIRYAKAAPLALVPHFDTIAAEVTVTVRIDRSRRRGRASRWRGRVSRRRGGAWQVKGSISPADRRERRRTDDARGYIPED